jgi:ubiquinone biosynthesis protein
VAKLHIDNNLVPADTNLKDFALTCRAIGESIVDVSVKQVSLAKLLAQLIKMTRKYNMVTKPELLLLQKTMMLVEGVGASLDGDLNMWELARPWMKDWATKNIGFDAKIRDSFLELFDMIKKILIKNSP